jgi:hypothetical protein
LITDYSGVLVIISRGEGKGNGMLQHEWILASMLIWEVTKDENGMKVGRIIATPMDLKCDLHGSTDTTRSQG